jgi:hypothetical protein
MNATTAPIDPWMLNRALVQPDPAVYEFLRYDFAGLTAVSLLVFALAQAVLAFMLAVGLLAGKPFNVADEVGS